MDDEGADVSAVVNLGDQTPTNDTQSEAVILPNQASPQDTSNWDNRAFTTPSDRIVIETFEGRDEGTIVSD